MGKKETKKQQETEPEDYIKPAVREALLEKDKQDKPS